MRKKEFRPKTRILDLKKDLGIEQDIKIEVWADPSRAVLFDLLEIFAISGEDELNEIPDAQKDKMNRRYFECASAILIDCDIEGIDFSTAESTEAAFDDERLPWGVFHKALMLYVADLTENYQVLKNVLRRVNELSNSGKDNEKNES